MVQRQIIVADRSSGTLDISVFVNDECNHAGAEYEELDFGQPVYRNGELDYEDDWRTVLVCPNDQAWYNKFMEEWFYD